MSSTDELVLSDAPAEIPVLTEDEALFGADSPRRLPVHGYAPEAARIAIARALGVSPEVVLRQLAGDGFSLAWRGIDAARDALRSIEGHGNLAKTILSSVPVAPRLAARPVFGERLPDEAGWALREAFDAAREGESLRRRGESPLFMAPAVSRLHRALDAYVVAAAGEPPRSAAYLVYDAELRDYRPATPDDLLPAAPVFAPPRRRRAPVDAVAPVDVALVGEHVLVIYPRALVHLTLSGVVRQLIPMSEAQVVGTAANGRYTTLLLPEIPGGRACVLDLDEDRFLDRWPEGPPSRGFLDGSLVDLRSATALRWTGAFFFGGHEEGMKIAYSPRGDLAWPRVTPASETVGLIDLGRAASIGRPADLLRPRKGEVWRAKPVPSASQRAVCRTKDGRIRILFQTKLFEDGRRVDAVRVPNGLAACFDPEGGRIAVASRTHVDVIALAGDGSAVPTLRLDLEPLHDRLAFDPMAAGILLLDGADAASTDALLERFGTVDALRRASVEEIVAEKVSEPTARTLLAYLEDALAAPGAVPVPVRRVGMRGARA